MPLYPAAVASGATTYGDNQVLSADATLATGYSKTYVDYVEIGSGFALELASNSVLEILT